MQTKAELVDHASEFDCWGCGRHIVTIGIVIEGPMCAECIHIPGWHDVPEICQIFDPELAAEKRRQRAPPPPWWKRLWNSLTWDWPR